MLVRHEAFTSTSGAAGGKDKLKDRVVDRESNGGCPFVTLLEMIF